MPKRDSKLLSLSHCCISGVMSLRFAEPSSISSIRFLTSSGSEGSVLIIFLRSLATSKIDALEEVVAAHLRYVASTHNDPDVFLTGAGRQLARLLPGDFRRVEAILQRTTQ